MPELFFDVSQLEPCEPLDQSLEAAKTLLPGKFLRIRYQRRPNPLLPLLQQLGCSWEEIGDESSEGVVLLIWRADDVSVLAEMAHYKEH